MKKAMLPYVAITALLLSSHSWAGQSYGSYMRGGMYKQWTVTSGDITYISGLAWDPTHTDINGNYDILYGGNASSTDSVSGVYRIDVTSESAGTLVDNSTTDKAWDLTVNPSGTIYVSCDGAPQVWRIENPLTTPIATQVMGNVRAEGDDDPICIGIMPSAFSVNQNFSPGQDVIVFDKGLDDNANDAIYVLDNTSTPESPVIDVVWEDTGNTGYSWCEVSQYDGYAYFALDNPTTDTANGNQRYCINRVNGNGNVERIFMDIDPLLLPTNEIDDAICYNPIDGSIWIPFDHSTAGRAIYRIDVANATALGGSDFLAATTKEITLDGDDVINVANNSMAFSPDGKFLACGDPTGADRMTIFSTVPVPEPTSLLLILTASLACAALALRK